VPVAVPGDPSQAAYWIVAACILPDSEVEIRDVYVGPARLGFVDVLRRMGADIETDAEAGTIVARTSALHGTDVEPGEVPGLIDEIPILAVAAAVAEGETRFHGVHELRVKESDRLATICSELGGFTAGIEATSDELVVAGGGGLVAADVDSHGDHRIAMSMAVAGLAAEGVTRIDGWDAVATSYPGFVDDLRHVTGERPD
jgi:3-phosphoshikimate 1-carboxyvinyltransferase